MTFAQNTLLTSAAMEIRMLDLFAPTAARLPNVGARELNMVSLWRKDAIHRAKNLSQLSTSLANLVTGPRRWDAVEVAAPARALARTYDALSLDNESAIQVPCFDMVSDVAMRLTLIFGRARNIAMRFSGDEVLATPEHRRALALICSELVINALKYAFPAEGPGTIAVAFGHRPTGIELVVADDGPAVPGEYRPGQGSGLLDRLAQICGATLTRSTSSGGTGLRVTVRVPLAVSAGEVLVA